MAQYIERAKVTDALIDNTSIVGSELEEAVNAICAIPAADVRPVVFCMDCDMYEYHEYDGMLKYVCRLFKRHMHETDFCSYGENREES